MELDPKAWRSTVAMVFTGFLSVLEYLIGNPFTAEMHGRGIACVCILLIVDFTLGTAAAIATGTWRFARLRSGCTKLSIWGVLLIVSRQLQYPTGIAWSDAFLQFVGQYILVYLIWIDTISILRHAVQLALLAGVSMPGLPQLVDRVERWHEETLARLDPPGWCKSPDACKCSCRSNGKPKGETS